MTAISLWVHVDMKSEMLMEMLGDWQHDTTTLADLFQDAEPFPHVVIDDFFSAEVADRIEKRFPVPFGTRSEWLQQGWHIYDNPIEGKLACDNVERMGNHDHVFADMWKMLQSDHLLELMSQITRIKDLEQDPHLHGAGLHLHPPGGRLEMHLDYSIHPISKKERRVNLIVYMNQDWKEEWGGHLALWEGTLNGLKEGKVATIAPMFNRAVLFRTSDVSWHGMPDPVMCPEGNARKSVAIYFVSESRPDATPRYKAAFRPRPGVMPPLEEMNYCRLCKIREERRLEEEDVKEHLPSFIPRWKEVHSGKH